MDLLISNKDMKKSVLLGTALFAALSVFSQAGRQHPQPVAVLDMRKAKAEATNVGANEKTIVSPMIGSAQTPVKVKSSKSSLYNWSLLCGSMNTYGMLVSNTRPLQYNPALNAVTFIHRKSTSYQPSPTVPSTAESGVIVAEVSTDWGTTWDSTCIWSDATNWGRYPQGAIYNPSGNTSLGNAYVVGSGPTVSGSSFTGNWYASKKLNTFDNVASTAPGAQQFLSFTLPSYPANQAQHGWSRTGFSSTTDGVVRSLAIQEDDLQGLSTVRGFAVVTGTFNGTAFDWSVDSITPNCILDGAGAKHLNPDPQMVWNPNGTIGYIVGVGALSTSTLCNKGYQPIIYKMDRTVNANATWSLLPSIDFNAPTMSVITEALAQQPITQPMVTGDSIGIPFVNDYDITIDANNDLHIGVTFMSTATDYPDSLNFISQFTTSINPGELYKWAHVSGSRPYLYDFIGNGSQPWKMTLVDSISSEGPSAAVGQPGYSENPWDNTGDNGAKVGMESRIQLGRTPDGQFITFSWAESDSSFTNNAFKWNNLPDIKTRLMSIGTGTNMYQIDMGPELNITANDNNVRTRATLHYMSPTTGSATIYPGSVSNTVEINTPFTVTNSNPYSQLTNNSTWYGANRLSYVFKNNESTPTNTTGITEKGNNTLSGTSIYPNPAQGSAVIVFALEQNTSVNVNVVNAVGQTVKSVKTNGNTGENAVRLDLSGLSSGIYLVNLKAGNVNNTKKLIVE
jgi:hypothetical protein